MAKKYQVIWRNIDLNDDFEKIDVLESGDVQLKDQYIRVEIGGEDNEVLYIPYYRIISIRRTGQDPDLHSYHRNQ